MKNNAHTQTLVKLHCRFPIVDFFRWPIKTFIRKDLLQLDIQQGEIPLCWGHEKFPSDSWGALEHIRYFYKHSSNMIFSKSTAIPAQECLLLPSFLIQVSNL